MRSFRYERAVPLLLALLMALSSAGCPELNRQPNRSGDPLFSVQDPATGELNSTPVDPVVGSPAGENCRD
jgi:hypothetical protein